RFCAGCKTEAIKDLQSGVDQTQLPLAHLGRRFVALLIDGLVMGILFIPVFIVMVVVQGGFNKASAPGAPDMGALGLQMIIQAVAWVIPMGYKAIMIQKWGQTVGKMAMGIKVVSPDGSAVTPGQAWMRSFIEMLLAGCCYVTYIVAFFNKDKCALHD